MLRIEWLVVVGLCAPTLLGCAVDLNSMTVDPGKYDYYSCHQLALQIPPLKTRAEELQSLIARADRGTGGAAVATVTYRPELASVRGSLELIDEVRQTKQCEKSEDAAKKPGNPPKGVEKGPEKAR